MTENVMFQNFNLWLSRFVLIMTKKKYLEKFSIMTVLFSLCLIVQFEFCTFFASKKIFFGLADYAGTSFFWNMFWKILKSASES